MLVYECETPRSHLYKKVLYIFWREREKERKRERECVLHGYEMLLELNNLSPLQLIPPPRNS